MVWQLGFHNVKFVWDGEIWHRFFITRCKHLNDNNLCSIYPKRSHFCRDHNPPHCEYYTKWESKIFDSQEELKLYFQKNGAGKKEPPPPEGKEAG